MHLRKVPLRAGDFEPEQLTGIPKRVSSYSPYPLGLMFGKPTVICLLSWPATVCTSPGLWSIDSAYWQKQSQKVLRQQASTYLSATVPSVKWYNATVIKLKRLTFVPDDYHKLFSTTKVLTYCCSNCLGQIMAQP